MPRVQRASPTASAAAEVICKKREGKERGRRGVGRGHEQKTTQTQKEENS
jgi:hypothetical protein